MDRGLLASTLVSLVGLVVMGIVAATVEPPLVTFAELDQKMGATVTVEADVASIESRPEGWTRMRLQQANGSVEAVAEQPVNVSAGDRVRATGQVGSHAGRIQLRIESSQDVRLIRPWRENHVPLSRLARDPWTYAGTHVRTSGTIEGRVLHSDHDAFGVPLRGATTRDGPHLVDAVFAYDPGSARFFLDVERTEPLKPA